MLPRFLTRAAHALTLAICCLYASIGDAQTQPSDDVRETPSVTIEAQSKLEERVHAYVRKITSNSRFQRESVARWNKPLCFEVAGLPKRDAQFMVERLTKIAISAGVRVEERGCSRRNANFYVVFTPDPAKTLKYLKWHPRLLFDRDASSVQMDRFLADSTPLPARIWHNADLMGANGTALGKDNSCAGWDSTVYRINCDAGGTRLRLQAVESLKEAVVVFDANRVNGFNIGQLSDYTAMAGLVDLDINADLADAPTILRLFTQPEDQRTPGLTEWDQAFLTATYHTDQRNFDQRDIIARNVARDLSKETSER